MARKPKPFDKIMMTKSKIDLFVQYGEHALGEQTIGEFMADVKEVVGYLMDLRNIINGMVSFDEPPQQAVRPYLDDLPGDEG